MPNIVHVVGTGTIGEPLIGLLVDHKQEFGIDEVTFMKRTPLIEDQPKVQDLIERGAKLAVQNSKARSFEAFDHTISYSDQEALERATVVIDCTPAGNANKAEQYEKLHGPNGFLAQGSETGFGKPYARGVNDEAIDPNSDRFVQIVSCNTHNISSLIKTLAIDADGTSHLLDGKFMLMRRANDISQDSGFVPSPAVGKHDDPVYGTHHAHDAARVFQTLGYDLPVFSSVVKLPTQYMHTMYFTLQLDNKLTVEDALQRLYDNTRIALTHKTSANAVFSFGRDHGTYGRLLNQSIVSVESLHVHQDTTLVGFSFTSQDGNSLLSSLVATLRYLDPDTVDQRIDAIRHFLFRWV